MTTASNRPMPPVLRVQHVAEPRSQEIPAQPGVLQRHPFPARFQRWRDRFHVLLQRIPDTGRQPWSLLAIGALGGMGVSLICFNLFAPVIVRPTGPLASELPTWHAPEASSPVASSTPTPASTSTAAMPVNVLPTAVVVAPEAPFPMVDLTKEQGAGDTVLPPPPTVGPPVDAAPAPATMPVSAAPPPKAFGGGVVMYQAPTEPAAPAVPQPAAAQPPANAPMSVLYHAPGTATPATSTPSGSVPGTARPPEPKVAVTPSPAPSTAAPVNEGLSKAYTVVSIPSKDVALVEVTLQGTKMVSPYKYGQKLPDGRVITGLDPEGGVIHTSGGDVPETTAR